MSGVEMDTDCARNLLIVSRLSGSVGQRPSGINPEVNSLVQETAFVTNVSPTAWLPLTGDGIR